MKRKLVVSIMILVASLSLFGCAAERTQNVSASVSQERCEQPVWKVGDYWVYRLFDGRGWAEGVIGVEDDVYIGVSTCLSMVRIGE